MFTSAYVFNSIFSFPNGEYRINDFLTFRNGGRMNETQITFADWLQNLPYFEYGKTLREIEEKTFVSRVTVYNWRVGNHNVPRYAQQIIKEIAGKDITFPKVKPTKSDIGRRRAKYKQSNYTFKFS